MVLDNAKIKRSKIIRVLENATNNDYQRRGIITKGAILETENGKCKVVSRPGQDGIITATLVKWLDERLRTYRNLAWLF